MNYLDSLRMNELYDELEEVAEQRKYIKKHRCSHDGKTYEQALQELDEEELYIRMKIEELSIVQSDFMEYD